MKVAKIATPSELNLMIQRDLQILGASVRETAEAVGLSPSRVEAICQQEAKQIESAGLAFPVAQVLVWLGASGGHAARA